MYSDDEIDAAVADGAISAEAAAALRTHAAAARRAPVADEEHFRLVSGFNDVFVVVASGLLLAALAWIGNAIHDALGGLAAAVAAWLLAEFFVGRRRMALPAIVLLIAFVAATFFSIMLSLPRGAEGTAAASAAAAAAAWLHWKRFAVPITVAAGAAAAVGGATATLFAVLPEARSWSQALFMIAGVTVFAYALKWDASDPQRQTRRADVAFWLHLLAAPLLVHPVFTGLGLFGREPDLLRAALVLALYLAIALVSLWIDRRALMISALGYVLYTFTELFRHSGVVNLGFATTALIVGTGLLLLSAFWQDCRAAVLPWLPSPLRGRLPHR